MPRGDCLTKRLDTVGWCLFALFLCVLLLWGGEPDIRGQSVAAAGIAIAAVIGAVALGWRAALALLAITLPVTLLIENIGVATGIPFGHYHFQLALFSVWIGKVPLLVGMLYFGVGLLCWLIAGVLAGAHGLADRMISRPVVAALLMVLWDLVMDPAFSTIGRVWVWHDGGAYFGVPLTNFLGWFVTTWIVFQLFALTLKHAPWLATGAQPYRLRDLRLAAILLYLGIGLTPVAPFLTLILTLADAPVRDGAGQVWHTREILGVSMVLGVCGMGLVSLLAARQMRRQARS